MTSLDGFEGLVRSLGFADAKEFHRLIAAVPMTSAGEIQSFKEWQYGAGTKEDLLLRFPQLAEAEDGK